MKKNFISIISFITVLSMLMGIELVFAEGSNTLTKIIWEVNNPQMIVNGKVVDGQSTNGATPVIHNGNVMIPVRQIVDAIGGTVEWLDVEQEVFIMLKNNRILCWPDTRAAQTTGSADPLVPRGEIWVDIMPTLINERMCVPIEFLEKDFGCEVKYDENTKTLEIIYDSTKDMVVKKPETTPSPSPATNVTESTLKKVGGDGLDKKLLFDHKDEWYVTAEAIEIADKYLAFQKDVGGWEKNADMVNITPEELAKAIEKKGDGNATLDNGATSTQIKFLAKVYDKTKLVRLENAIDKGIMYIISAQYDNGGWPQSFPIKRGLPYHEYITFNDGAMSSILGILRDIAIQKGEYASLNETIREKCRISYEKGLACVLKLQIVVNGKKTAWAQQYEQHRLLPAKGRPFEHAAIGGAESTGVINFLMEIDNPTPEIIDAVQSAVKWYDDSKIEGIRPEKTKTTYKLIPDPTAPTIWARFYDVETNKPFTITTGERKTFDLNSFHPRMLGYQFFNTYGQSIVENYKKWAEKWVLEESRIKINWKK